MFNHLACAGGGLWIPDPGGGRAAPGSGADTAIVVTAYTSAINGKHYGFAAALAIAGLALTAIASVAALNGVNAATLAEPALIEMQERVGARLKTESMRIARLQTGIRQRRAAVAVTFGLGSLIDIGALLYALIH